MSLHSLEIREVPGGRAFYIDGSLQFDTRDEAVYHEALAVPPLALAAARFGRPLSALVLGGGDGLALKRLLSGGNVKRAELVDRDPGVLALARKDFAAYNGGALDDRRVKVRVGDAAEFLAAGRGLFDLALADFTFPDDIAGCSLFTRRFFSAVRSRLSAGGLFAMNAISPDRFPAAFWSIYRTLVSARLYPRPLRISIPSFNSHGYGDWGMFLASPRPIKDPELAALAFGAGRAWLTGETFKDALRLRLSGIEQGLPLSGIIKKPGDLLCLINLQEEAAPGAAMADFSDSASARRLLAGLPGADRLCWPQLSAEWEWRLMETLRLMDWEPFLAELEKSAAGLPGNALAEIRLLRQKLPELLKGAVPDTDRAWQVFALLMTVLVFVNMAYPDNAYAKGYYSHGSSSGGSELDISFFVQTEKSPFHHKNFQGNEITAVVFPSGSSGLIQHISYKAPGTASGPDDVKTDRLYFALTDEAFVSKEGEVFYVLGQGKYLLNARPGRFVLYDKQLPEPIFEFYPEPGYVQSALGAIEQHVKSADKALASYGKWLAWARPAVLFSDEVRAESNEARNIAVIKTSLLQASQNLQQGAAPLRPEIPAEWQRLAPGFYLADDRELVLADRSGQLYSYLFGGANIARHQVLERRMALDGFVRSVLFEKYVKTSGGDPRLAIFRSLLEMP